MVFQTTDKRQSRLALISIKSYKNSNDYLREVATAKTHIETASMWAVKALTNNIHREDE